MSKTMQGAFEMTYHHIDAPTVQDEEYGIKFETREEAEKAVDKLKAWRRLKDKGLKAFSAEIYGDDFVVSFKLTNHVDYSQSIDDFERIFDFGVKE